MVGIEHALKSVDAVKALVIDGVKVAKDGLSLSDLPALFKVLNDVKNVLDHAPQALPELKDLDPTEAGQLTTAAYQAVQEILVAVAALK